MSIIAVNNRYLLFNSKISVIFAQLYAAKPPAKNNNNNTLLIINVTSITKFLNFFINYYTLLFG